MDANWTNADIPDRYRKYGLEAFRQGAAWLEQLRRPECWCLYIWGETGSRKTTLAAAMLMELRKIHGSPGGRFGHFVTSYQAIKAMRDIDNHGAAERLKAWHESPCLVLDDLGKHRDTPHVIEQTLFLLHHRYDWASKAKTIITANMDLDELASRVDPATARRLAEGMVLELAMPK